MRTTNKSAKEGTGDTISGLHNIPRLCLLETIIQDQMSNELLFCPF